MTWFRLDDNWLSNPKIRAAGLRGRALWVAGGTLCAQHLTDGHIDKSMLPFLASMADIGNGRKEAALLVTLGLWIDYDDHWVMNDYLGYNPTREKVEAERAKAADRQRRMRESRRDSRRDEGVSHASPDPTRPDPTQKLLTVVPTTTIGSGGAEAVVEESIQAIAAYEAVVAKGSGVQPDKGWVAYERGIANRVRRDDRDRLADQANAHPEWTAVQLRDWYLEPESFTSYGQLVPGIGGSQ